MKSIEFTAAGCCNALGNFASGDIARNVDAALADHLVNEVGCAKWLEAPKPAEPEPVKKTRKSAEQKDTK
jgi:hypothetical protein